MSIQAERMLIGCILIDNDSIRDIYTDIRPEMFMSGQCQMVFKAMRAMYDLGKPVDLMSVTTKLKAEEIDNDVIMQFLADCIEATPTSVSITSYADDIIKDFKVAKVRDLATVIATAKADNVDDVMAGMVLQIEALQNNRQLDLITWPELSKKYEPVYFHEHEKGVMTGFDHLDECLGGLTAGDVTVVAARPAVGKTALALQLTEQIAANDKRVFYFNLEMSDAQIFERSISSNSEIELTRVRRASSFLGDEEERYKAGNEIMRRLDITLSTGPKTVNEMKAMVKNQEADLIVIDYMQLIKPERRNANRAVEVGEISRAVKAMAMELHVPIIMLSQLNRRTELAGTNGEPTMADLRESGDIEQDASNVVLLWNMSEDRIYKGIKVDKIRQGQPDTWGMVFDGAHMHFGEIKKSFADFKKFVETASENPFTKKDEVTNPFDD